MNRLPSEKRGQIVLFFWFLLSFSFTTRMIYATERLVPLSRPGPWSGVSGLIGYGERLWFVNSVKFSNHNSADLYSYDPLTGETRYERHLFSQDAGEPVVMRSLLYWPFEDPRFSTGRGEYMVTNGQEWQWGILPHGQVFHVHAMATHQNSLFAATSAWRAGLQRSDDQGATWKVIYDHPTPPGLVSRITTVAFLGNTLYAGLTTFYEEGIKLLRLAGDTIQPMPGWPSGKLVPILYPYRGWLYGVNITDTGSALWRTDGQRVERVTDLDGYHVRDLVAGPSTLWAITAEEKKGILWRSDNGISWRGEQRFNDAEPLDVALYAGRVYVGTIGPATQGTLWGPPPPAPIEAPLAPQSLPSSPSTLTSHQTTAALAFLDRTLADKSSYAAHGARLLDFSRPLALSKRPEVGYALVDRLQGPFPDGEMTLFGGNLRVSLTQMARWYLLWAIALQGYGRIPVTFLFEPWAAPPNSAEKYFELPAAAAWAVTQVHQADRETLVALLTRLKEASAPQWLHGDFIGALTVLTGQRFGYDLSRWREWGNHLFPE